jgi:uncharacterized membrane-anchored protein
MARMKSAHLPVLDARYWAAILAASLAGTTLGDFVSTALDLGFIRGLIPLAIVLTAIFYFERRSTRKSEAYYWAAIVVTRTMATNVADLFTHALKLDYQLVATVWTVVLVVTLLPGKRRITSPSKAPGSVLTAAGARYWIAILFASVLGTTLGDFVSDGLGLGVLRGGIALTIVLCAVLAVQFRFTGSAPGLYWAAIVAVRTAGTDWGDFLSGADGLNLGYGLSAAASALLLVCILRYWPASQTVPPRGARFA